MERERKLKDTISALFMSYFIIISIFQVTSRFLSVKANVCIAVVGLILAVVFLFVNPDNRRTMRIVSIACNSIAIGSVIGILYSALSIVLPMVVCIGISLLFIGFTFLVYYLIYILNSKIVSSILCGVVIFALVFVYFMSVYKALDMVYNYYIIIFGIMTIIHYIIAIMVVHSDKNSIITGMAYGYFAITIAVIIVVAIFLLLASDGDIDFDINGDGKSESKSKSSAVGSKGTKTTSEKPTSRVLNDSKNTPPKRVSKVASASMNKLSNSDIVLDAIDMGLYTLDSIAEALSVQGLYLNEIHTLRQLDRLHQDGVITKEQYYILRDELFPDIV